ncbi:hypothetical protein NQZ68_019339 [Dissostichus eleginoides]|nr:hypothetical protein NQZ68_019339 [Dissostichus eleginoides]
MGGKLKEALGKVGMAEREKERLVGREDRGKGGSSGGEEEEVGRRRHLEKEKEDSLAPISHPACQDDA